jgi:hypothetical protein
MMEGQIKNEENNVEKPEQNLEEIKAEQEAFSKLSDIKEIFYRNHIWGEYDCVVSRHRLEKFPEIKRDLMIAKNYFHHVGFCDNFEFLKNPQISSVSCYPFWGYEERKHPPIFVIDESGGNEKEIANEIDVSVVINSDATERARQYALKEDFWVENPTKGLGSRSCKYDGVPYFLYHAEALLQDQDKYNKPQIISAIIFDQNRIREHFDVKTGETLTFEQYTKFLSVLDSRNLTGLDRSKEYEKLIGTRHSSPEIKYKVARELGLVSKIPVFDINGNMLWPKQMSYEEVKKFVEERNKEKEKNNA